MIRPIIRRVIPILCVLALLPAQFASAQNLPEGMTMHRAAAGALDSSGWTDAVSTEGGFSVRIPMKFNDFTMHVPASKKGTVSKMFAVGAKSAAGVKYLTTRLVYRQKGHEQAYFARFEKGKAIKGATVKPHMFRGRKAVDLVAVKRKTRGQIRVVLLKDSLIMMTAEYPHSMDPAKMKGQIATFFASLRVTRP